MNKEEILEYCLTHPGSYIDYPFGEEWTVIRHRGNKKIFALIYSQDSSLRVNLKCEPGRADFLRSAFEEVKPGYHMNKEHWNTVILDGGLPEDEVFAMVKHSYELTKPKEVKRKPRP